MPPTHSRTASFKALIQKDQHLTSGRATVAISKDRILSTRLTLQSQASVVKDPRTACPAGLPMNEVEIVNK